jgi:hypothetical protein
MRLCLHGRGLLGAFLLLVLKSKSKVRILILILHSTQLEGQQYMCNKVQDAASSSCRLGERVNITVSVLMFIIKSEGYKL